MNEITASHTPINLEQLIRIQKECFWDYNITAEEILNIVQTGTYQEKKKLFFKILYNSTDRLSDLMLFSESDLKSLFKEPLPEHKSKHIQKKVAILRYLLLHETVGNTGLEWKLT
ncbi:MAG TPA: hypothetical protein PLK03_02170 [Termitinemataceae bacterium]|nr:hypothetical protein [Termitinemataceae bacterium]